MRQLIFLFALLPSLVFATNFEEGRDYKTIPAATSSSQKSVLEFFSYGCPWCFELEKSVEALQKSLPKDISFQRIPVTFEQNWTLYAKAFYTAKALKQEATLTPLLFQAIQKDDTLNTSQEMIEFFIKHGAKEAFVTSAFESSPTMNALVKNGAKLMRKYQVYGVPAFVVNQRYKTDLVMVKGDKEKLIALVKYLIDKP